MADPCKVLKVRRPVTLTVDTPPVLPSSVHPDGALPVTVKAEADEIGERITGLVEILTVAGKWEIPADILERAAEAVNRMRAEIHDHRGVCPAHGYLRPFQSSCTACSEEIPRPVPGLTDGPN
jgi:hypothetical protein